MTTSSIPLGKPLGCGLTAEVYRWSSGRVLKLFRANYPAEQVEDEFRITQSVHALGVPCPAAFELVDLNGRYGFVMERIDGESLLMRVQSRPWTMLAAVRQLAALQVDLHRIRAPASLPAQRDWLARRIAESRTLSEERRQRALSCLSELPDGETLCHGDFHPENILLTTRGPVIIDWSRAARGCPAGDVGCTSQLMQHAKLPDSAAMFLHAAMKFGRRWFHEHYLRAYVQSGLASRAEIAAWTVPLAAAAAVDDF